MKKLLVLMTVAMLTATAVGCECWNRQVRYSPPCSTGGCGSSAIYGGGYGGAPYADAPYVSPAPQTYIPGPAS